MEDRKLLPPLCGGELKRRPIEITVLGCLLAAAGGVGLVYHLTEFQGLHPFPYGLLGISLVRVLAIVAGLCLLKAKNWARWLALAWIAFHAGVSAFHSSAEFATHAVLLAVFAYFLLRQRANAYFAGTGRFSA